MPTETETKLNKLEALLKIVDEGVTKQDFVNAFESVVRFVQSIQKSNEKEFALIKEHFALFEQKLTNDNSSELADMKKTCQDMMDSMMKQMDAKMASLRDGMDGEDGMNGVNGIDGAPGKDADEEAIYQRLLKDLKAELKKIPERPTTTIFGPGKTRFVKYDISDQLDGVTKTFTLGTHFGIHSVQSSSSPFGAWREGIDYNEVGKTIVFTAAVDASVYLAQGQSMIVKVLR